MLQLSEFVLVVLNKKISNDQKRLFYAVQAYTPKVEPVA